MGNPAATASSPDPTAAALFNVTAGRALAARVERADTFLARLRGWMGRRPVPEDAALRLAPCDAVHTFFVRAPLDVVYCDRAGRVLRVVAGLKPSRIGPRVRGAEIVWEMRAGGLAPHVTTGDILEVMEKAGAAGVGGAHGRAEG